ncbi:abnormal spindle-like microcephaly-associated protein [Diretmus argenteus]
MTETATSTRKAFADFSPIKKDDNNKENDVPVLSLIQFSKAPFVTFGSVKLGTSKSAVLHIENPTEDAVAEVSIDKVPSSKGFSVDQSRFTVQPETSFSLTVTWTPTEEGGVRELIIFNANGVLKHQAVLLGRAEAPKKKKKSLWDSIKKQRAGERPAAPRGKKTDPSLKITANKTFQMSRNPQYKREKPRSPLSSLNKAVAVRERSLSKRGPLEDRSNPEQFEQQRPCKPTQRQRSLALSEQAHLENVHNVRKNSPVVLLVPAIKLMDCKPENGDITRVLNKTVSPVGTPERFKTLMPHIPSAGSLAPATGQLIADESDKTGVPFKARLSVRDALTLIDSDLPHVDASPPDTCSSYDLSDSLESGRGNHGCKPDITAPNTFPDSPEQSESNEPRLTFFVSKLPVKNQVVAPAVEVDHTTLRVKRASFTSATVTKSKATAAAAPLEVTNPSGRKVKKSRRRLLEKTLDLSDGSSQCESRPGTPCLPVIDSDARTEEGSSSQATSSPYNRQQAQEALCFSPRGDGPYTPVTSPSVVPAPFTFPVTSPLPMVTFTVTSPLLSGPDSPLYCELPSNSIPPQCVQEDLTFPVHSQTECDMAARSKKRKSDEYLRPEKFEEVEKSGQVKRSKVAAVRREPARSAQEKRCSSQRQQPRKTGQQMSSSVRSTAASSVKVPRSAAPAQVRQPNSKPTSRGAQSLRSFGAAPMKMAKVVAVAQSKLTFIKPTQTAIPRHPMPFAAKNMFYDERWIEKQDRGFTWWINHVLTPDDFKVNTEVTKVSAVSLATGSNDKCSIPKAPTKEEMSFSTYTARRKLNRLRRSACQLFTSEAMVKAIQRLELEVEAKRLLVRKDRHLWKDIGERQKVLNWLLFYNPLWLRIGLETIFGELISLESNSDALGLAVFILQRLLWNPDIAAEFRHAKVPNLYKDGHEEALSRFTLKKLLLLVCFLDKAKESRLIEHDPCLFCMDAEFKTSKDLLLAFSRDFLSGEGILPRHLGYMGLPVSHVQTPLDEFNFAVKNLAVDLKCGIRLVRVMELFIQDWSLSRKLRLPAISRLQKVHNVDIALQVLKDKGVDLTDERGSVIDSRDIVDGHREKTLSLLWKIIFAFQVEVVLDEEQLREEIGFLRRTFRTKRSLASLRADQGLQQYTAKARVSYEHSSTKITLLMDWVNAVCDFYNLRAENFTVSFSDGRVLCYLIHHYHPSHLPEEAVSRCTTQTVECSHRGQLELNCSTSDSDNSFGSLPTRHNGPESSSMEFKELLGNEKNNFRLVNTAVAFLGGVPAMITPADMSNTIPNEKVVMSYLSFLCARLLDLRNETRAARVIQGAWRKYRLKKDLQLYQERYLAAAKIQVVVRRFLQRRMAKRQNDAAVIIQSVWRGYAARNALRLKTEAQLRILQHKAATAIQTQWRMYSAMRAYQRLKYHAIVVQAQWRRRRAASAYRRVQWAVTVIQKYARASALARREQKQYILLRQAVLKIQGGYRRWKARRTETENHAAKVIQAVFKKWHKKKNAERTAAALKIQSWYRMHRCLRQYRNIRRSTVLIQAQYRGLAQRRHFQMLRLQHHSAVVIQSVFRGHSVRQQVAKMRRASIIIQRWFMACVKRDLEREKFVKMRRAAIIIQTAYRGQVARNLLKKWNKAATVIQAAFRTFAAKKRYVVLKNATVVIQQMYRAKILVRKTKKEYDSLRYSALTIQAVWRGRAVRKRIEKLHQCATLIQAHYHCHKVRGQYKSRKAAAVVIQRHFRGYMAGKKKRTAYLQVKAAAVTLQAGFRGMRVRIEMKKKHQAATVIQSAIKMVLCRKQYLLLQSAAIIIQCRYRALLEGKAQRREYRQLRQATLKIQAAYRGFNVREALKKRHNAATVIQAQFRMHKVHMAYLATRCAAIIMQERYRAKRLRDQQVQRYRAMKSAAIVIQAAYRGHRARLEVTAMHRAATVIQRRFLTVQDRKRFLAIKAAALFCQQRYRAVALARKDRLDYLLNRRAAILLQAAYRGFKVRKQLHIEHMAAITIQSHVRKHLHRTYYKRLCCAANIVQARYRANMKMREEMQALNAKRAAAVVLQAAFRGMKARQSIKQSHQAASAIQRAYRAHRERKQYLSLKSSVLTVQRRYRATIAAKEQRQQYQQTRRAAIILQAAYKGQQARKEVAHQHRAATLIQSAYRKHRDKVKFQAMRLSAIIIQRSYRSLILGRKERDGFLKMKHSAIVLQAAFRGHFVRTNIANMHRAATVIQANFKRHKLQSAFRKRHWAACVLQQRFRAQNKRSFEMKHYQQVRQAVITLQAAYRGMKSRQSIRQSHQAASAIQRAYRAHRERKQYLSLKSSVLTVQRRYRATIAAKEQRQQYQQTLRAAIILQAAYRGQQARKEVAHQHRAATLIQSAYRKHRDEVKFQAMRLSAIIIQRSYRSLILGRKERDGFLKMKHSAIVLQAAFRGHFVRTNVANMHRAATVIQANFKRHKLQSAFRKQHWAACVIQQRFRAQNKRSFEMKHYQQVRQAVITLQAAYRGMKSRQSIEQSHQAASAIQRAYRAHRERKQYLTLKSSVLTVQRWYRATIAAKEQRQQYHQTRRAAIILQAAYRGQQARKEVAHQHRAATLIQSAYRKHRDEVKFQAMRLSAIIIQRSYRSLILGRKERDGFLKMKHSAIVLQAAFRGHFVRTNIADMHRAATVIQANFKRHKLQSAFRKQHWAACVIQQRFRAHNQRSFEMKHYQQVRQAVITLQAAYRGMKSRQSIRQSHQAASAIQRAYRAHRERKQYLSLKSSVLTVQRRYRATIAAKEQRQQYHQTRRAAIILQAAYRGQQARKEVAHQHRAATLIQSAYRKHRDEVKFQAMRLSAIIIQRSYRSLILGRKERDGFLKMKHSAIVLQAAFRGHFVQTNIANMHRAATVIQANFKRHKLQSAFRKRHWAVCVIQQRFRAQNKRSFEMKHYQQVRQAVITLQAAYRGMKSRQSIRQSHQAASAIQRAYRAHQERKQYLTLKSSVLTVQRRYRATIAAKEQRQQYHQTRRAAIILQAAYRGQQARKEVAHQHRAATLIQSAYRKHRDEVKFQAMRLSAIIIQRSYRSLILGRKERDWFLKMKHSAIVLQAAFRGHFVRTNIANMHRAATVIQANFKRHKLQSAFRKQHWAACVIQQRFRAQNQRSFEMKHYQQVRQAVITLQAAYRGMKSRQSIRQSHQAASAIQRAYRAHRERKQYLTLKSSVLTVQRRYRATIAAKEQRQQYHQTRRAAIILQAAYRGQQARKEVRHCHLAATVIQAVFRQHREKVKFQAMRLSAIIIQRNYRSLILGRKQRDRFLKMKHSAIVLQAAFKGQCVRRDIGRQNQASTVIQAFWRCSVQRRYFQRQREAAVMLQRRVRAMQLGRAERGNYTRMRHAAIVLQAHCRGWVARRQALEAAKAERRLRFSAAVFHHLSATRIQRALRAHWALQSAKRQIHSVIAIQRWVRARQQRRRYLEERRKVVMAQRAVRRWLDRRHKAASAIQHIVRNFLLLKQQKRIQRGIIKIQALWRGHRSRRLNDKPKVVNLRHCLRKISAGAREEDKLYYKTSSALDYLLRYKHFSNILEALKNLETTTRLSPVCCERLVESRATHVIFTLIRSCNRSVPCMEVITYSIQILLNLSKYHKTIEAVYAVENSVDTLLDLLQRYREKAGDKVAEKGGSIFTKACFLLVLLLQDQHRALEVRKLPKALDRICSIYRLTARKHKMDEERTIIKQKMNASINRSFLVHTTPRKSRPVPKFAPDWVLRKDKLKDIVDPLRAIQMVAGTFSIVL